MREQVKASPQFLQRLTVRLHLSALSPEETRHYLHHRLQVAGGRAEIFTAGAEDLLVRASGGIPRRVNGLADMALLAGYGRKAPLVDEEIMQQAVKDGEN